MAEPHMLITKVQYDRLFQKGVENGKSVEIKKDQNRPKKGKDSLSDSREESKNEKTGLKKDLEKLKKAFEKLASQKTQEPFKSHNGQDLPSIKRSSSGSGEDTEMPKKKKNRTIITKKINRKNGSSRLQR